ncbi:MAG: Ankyrin [Bacteroidetes bacterium]|jgi:ankyrin repeat protein|nr:Ankyrin [Bacteroidota bacterium]
MKLILISLLCLLMQTGLAQKLFTKIEKTDRAGIKSYLAGTCKYDDLFAVKTGTIRDSSVTFTFSVIEWSAIKNCQPCLEEFIDKRKKLEEHLNVDDELDKCLAHAARNGNMQMLEFLIKNKADVNHLCESCQGQAPIQVALNYNNYDIFFRLLKLGADPTVENFREQNLLHTLTTTYLDSKTHKNIPGITATKSLDVAKIIIDTLINRKVDINKKSREGATVLIYTASANQPQLYDYIKAKGARLNKEDKKEVASLINYAMSYKQNDDVGMVNNNNMFEKVLKDERITLTKELAETPDIDGECMITGAVKTENKAAFKQVMQLKPNLNVKDAEGYSTISWAVANGQTSMSTVLLDNGVKVDKQTLKEAKKVFKADKELLKKFESAPKTEEK